MGMEGWPTWTCFRPEKSREQVSRSAPKDWHGDKRAVEGAGFAKAHLVMTGFDLRLMQCNATRTHQFYKLLAERARDVAEVRSKALAKNVPQGAANSDVLRLVMGNGLVLVGVETAAGLAMGFAVERLMNSMLFNAGGVDIVAYLVVVPALLAVTTLAAYVPARKASRIAPTQALRYE